MTIGSLKPAFVAFLFSLLLEAPASPDQSPATSTNSQTRSKQDADQNPGPPRVEHDVVYGQAGEVALQMDLYFPSNTPATNVPVVMYVHGGGWVMGGKDMVKLMPWPEELLRRGYVVASINYRLGSKYKFPAMIEDAKCAVRFLRAHARVFGLDADHIGVIGDSAGGQLVSLLGLTGDSSEFDGTGGWSHFSAQVQAVVDMYGPSDFTDASASKSLMGRRILKAAFGTTSQDAPILKQASPMSHVTSNAPPFLILHGDHDKMVQLRQSENLNDALQAAGVTSSLLVITNYSHGFTPWRMKASPDPAALAKIVADFFDQHLR